MIILKNKFRLKINTHILTIFSHHQQQQNTSTMNSAIVTSALLLLGIVASQASSVQYPHDVKFTSRQKTMKMYWFDGGEYEIGFGDYRFQFDSGGKLSESIIAGTQYEFGATSEACNVPTGVVVTTGNTDTLGSDKDEYTCSQCNAAADEACDSGISQICNYAPSVAGNRPPFDTKAKKIFSKMCDRFYTACESGRVSSECDTKCSDPQEYVLEAEECSDGVCIPQLEASLEWDSSTGQLGFYVDEPVSALNSQGTLVGLAGVMTVSDGLIEYVMYSGLDESVVIGDYTIGLYFISETSSTGVDWNLEIVNEGNIDASSGNMVTGSGAVWTDLTLNGYFDDPDC